MKLSTIRRLIKEADATAAPAGDFDEFMTSIEQLEKHAKERRVMEPNYSKEDLLSDIHRELPDIDTEMADKMVDFVFKHLDTDVSEASISVDMQEAPTAEELDVGEPVKIVGNVNYHGKCGHIDSFGRDKKFVIVDLGNDGLRSFHSSDVSYYAADDNDESEDGDIEESAVNEADSHADVHLTANQFHSSVRRIMQDIAQEYQDQTAAASSSPSAPDTGKFRSTRGGMIEYASKVNVHGGYYGSPKTYLDFIKIGGGLNPQVTKDIFYDFSADMEDQFGVKVAPGLHIKTTDGYTFFFPSFEEGTNWGGFGFTVSKAKTEGVSESDGDEEQGYTLGTVLPFPDFIKQLSVTLRKSNLNWKMTKRDDNVFLFSAPNDYNIHNMLVIAVVHNGWVSATNGVVYPDGEVSMGDKQELPMTVASVSEIAQEAIQSYHSLDLSDYADELGEQGVAEGEVTKTNTGRIHRATDKYGAGEEPFHPRNPGKYARDLDSVNKQQVKDLDASMGINWKNRGTKGVTVDEDTEGEKPTTWYKDNKAYSLQRTGSTFSLLDQSGKVVQIIQVPPRYIPMNLEDQGFKMSRTGREYYKNPGWFKEAAGDNPEDVITVDVPLFIRLMEYAREDAKTDMDLHKVTEKLTAMSAEGRTLSMADYDAIISTDTVEEEQVNEVSPHNFDSDIDYYDALRARKPQRQEPDEPASYDDDYNDRLRFKPAAAKPSQHLNNEEGNAPNGKKYNNTVTFSGGSAAANKAAADSFADYHWGAKDVVDAKQDGDTYVLYVVDNHKYGMWKPWKEAKVGEAAGQKEKSAFQKGYEAGLSRRPEPNPYAAGTKENAEFRDGEHNGRADRDTHYESTITKGVVLNEYAAFKKGIK